MVGAVGAVVGGAAVSVGGGDARWNLRVEWNYRGSSEGLRVPEKRRKVVVVVDWRVRLVGDWSARHAWAAAGVRAGLRPNSSGSERLRDSPVTV